MGLDNCWDWKPVLDGKEASSHPLCITSVVCQQRQVHYFQSLTCMASSQIYIHLLFDFKDNLQIQIRNVQYNYEKMDEQMYLRLQIMKLLGVKGPQVGKLTAALMEFQLAQPKASKAEAEAFLQQKHATAS